MTTEKRQTELEELYKDLDQRKLVGIILELTIENIDLKKQLSIHGVVKSLKDKEIVPFEDWRKENCTHLEGDLYSFKQNVFDSYDLRYVYMRECKQSL